MEQGPVGDREEQLTARQQVLDALAAFDRAMECGDNSIVLTFTLDAVFLGQIKSRQEVRAIILPDEDTVLSDIAKIAMDGAHNAVAEMLQDVREQYEGLDDDDKEDKPHFS